MVAIWIGILILVQLVVLVFALALCKSAARADREFERARNAEQWDRALAPEWLESKKAVQISPDTRPTARLNHPLDISGR